MAQSATSSASAALRKRMSSVRSCAAAAALRLGSCVPPRPLPSTLPRRAPHPRLAAGASLARRPRAMAGAGVTCAATAEQPCFKQTGYRRPLHWVFKVGDLKATLEFYQRVFGMKVHRHEEFASGCEATCNGPFGGAWSKTMIGFGSEDTHFALELTYNYGISSYERGNDLRYIAVSRSAVKDASAVWRDESGREFVSAPDGYPFLLVDAPAPADAATGDPFLFVSVSVSDLAASVSYYTEALKARVVPPRPGCVGGTHSALLSFSGRQEAALELVQLPAGTQLHRGVATGRWATETEDGAPKAVAAAVRGAAGVVLHGPLVLQPHGEEVAIVQDPDGMELCFVDARGYRACTAVAHLPGGATVDWPYRQRLAAAASLTGEAARAGVAAVLAGDYDSQEVNAQIDALVAASPVVVFSQTSCPFCKKSKALLQAAGVRESALRVVELDTLGAKGHAFRAELAKRTGRSSVPNIFIGGQNVGGFGDGPGVNTLQEEGTLAGMLAKAGAL